MAVQIGIAYSSIIKGVGVVAAGPYYCSQNDTQTAITRCSCTGEPYAACRVSDGSTSVSALVAKTLDFHARALIDDPANVRRQRVVTISGANDTTVPPAVVRQLDSYYGALGVVPGNLSAAWLPNAAHTMPTLNYGTACGKSESPFIGKCQYDAAEAILGWIYGPGPLTPRAGSRPLGRFIKFDQAAFIPKDGEFAPGSAGLDSTAWIYVPDECKRGAKCRLHVALHGCRQGQDYLPLKGPPGGGLYYGTTFVKHSGYDKWADNNRIVVLFPQALSIPQENPFGCWDWWGYTDAHYADQQGVQMQTIRAMIERLTSGATP
ncbi:poly(3-hydroxybutyrate) depolymerase [Paraburkholderia sp. LEh10]|nr:poly(3-hydroxybutyrate) depolymerase [Paraburkholderia sp. LEh10]